MTPADLTTICEEHYGNGWKAALARDLDVNERTVRRWATGQNPVPDWVPGALVEAHKARLDRITASLRNLEFY